MLIRGLDDQTVSIRVLNSPATPLTEDEAFDAWLRLHVRVHSHLGKWQTVDETLTVFEVRILADWFEDLADRKDVDPHRGFTEPCLSFEVLDTENDGPRLIRIHFNAELKPKSAKRGQRYFVDFEADEPDLRRLARDLRRELEPSPESEPE